MSQLYQRYNKYVIKFSRTIDGNRKTKTLSLGIEEQDLAEEMQSKLDGMYEQGKIDPFHEAFSLDDMNLIEKATENVEKNKVVEGGAPYEKVRDIFLEQKRLETRKATAETYEDHLRYFGEFTSVEGVSVRNITEDHCRSFVWDNDNAQATRLSKYTHISAFFNWAYRDDYISENPIEKVKRPKIDNKVSASRILDEKGLKKLLGAHEKFVKKAKAKKGYHDRLGILWFPVIVTLIWDTGIRRKEATFLRIDDIIGDFEFINVRKTKNGRERKIPLFPEALSTKYLKDWVENHDFESGDWLFPGQAEGSHIAGCTFGNRFSEFRKKAGLPENWVIHNMRHTAITRWQARGFATTEAKEMAGHENLEMTDRYTHISKEDLRQKGISLGF